MTRFIQCFTPCFIKTAWPLAAVTCVVVGLAGMTIAGSSRVMAQAADEYCSQEEADQNADCRSAAIAVKKARENKTGQQSAPFDLTGYWASVITEDWRWRVVGAAAGDVPSVPLSHEGMRVAKTWDASKADTDCKQYGAAGLLRNPLRVHLTWESGNTLLLQTDHGVQTRRMHFDAIDAAAAPSMQGQSTAKWEAPALKVVTTQLSPGYLRRNGVPYSASTRLTEYFNRYSAFGTEWLTVTTVVSDPVYLSREFITSSHFKRLADGKAWRPTPCGAS